MVNLVLMALQKQKGHCFSVGNVSVGYEPKSSDWIFWFDPSRPQMSKL